MDTLVISEPSVEVEYPTLSDRFQSTFMDTILIVILMFVIASVLERYDNAPDWIRIALFFGIWGIYEPICTSLGFTVGNYLKGIRVRKAGDTKERLNIIQALFRYILKICLGWVSFLTIHFNPQRRAIHDLAAGSVMIRINQNK
jgi:uncharacterized RDD family membrane protein YckC